MTEPNVPPIEKALIPKKMKNSNRINIIPR